MTVRRHGDHKEPPEEWSRCSGQLEDASAPTAGPQEPGGRSFLGGSGERPRGSEALASNLMCDLSVL